MKICIIEDNIRLGKILRKSFGSRYRVDVYENGQDAVLHATSEVYDIILLDMSLPDMSGLEVCKQLRQNGITAPIIIITGDDSIKSKVSVLDNGADDYIMKPFSNEELKARIRAVMRRSSRAYSSGKMIVHDLELDPANRTVKRQGKVISLRRREFDLLEYMMRNKGRTVTRSMIIDHVWTGTNTLWTNAIDVHIKSLRDKIDRPFGTRIIKTIHGIGYKLEIIEGE